MANVLTRLGPYWFNASRPDGNRFITAPVPVQIQLSDEKTIQRFVAVEDWTGLVRCEAVGFNGDFLQAYQVSSDGVGQLLDVPAIRLDSVAFDNKTNVVTAGVARMLPLTSSHCGQPIRLAFVFCERLVSFSEPFVVCAKQTKAGAKQKHSKPKPQELVSPERELKRAMIATAVATIGLTELPPPSFSPDVSPKESPAVDGRSPLKRSKANLSLDITLACSTSTAAANSRPGHGSELGSYALGMTSDFESFLAPPSAADAFLSSFHARRPDMLRGADASSALMSSVSRGEGSVDHPDPLSELFDPFTGMV